MSRGSWLPAVCGLATAALAWWVWGSWDPVPMVHDESAYLLQAEIFAGGRWAAPAAPLPGFFEQMHVLSAPTRAAKYPPGHALVLAPGAAIGLPALVPVALAGAAGALLVVLARKLSNSSVALLAWLIWLGSPGGLVYRSAYFSESTTTVLWLLGWWALDRWLATSQGRWLGLLSFCVGWGYITRPLTTIAFALPAGFVVLRRIVRRRSWKALLLGPFPGIAVLLLLPLWSARTTGDVWVSPLEKYTRDYLPYDKPGFILDDTPPRLELPPDLRGEFFQMFRAPHVDYRPARLPRILFERMAAVARDFWGGWPLVPSAFALLGLFVLARPAWVAVASAALLPLLYLSYAHVPVWTLYYVESFPVLGFLTGLGLWTALRALTTRRSSVLAHAPALAAAVIAILVLLDSARQRSTNLEVSAPRVRFRSLVLAIPDSRAIVFVRYAPQHDPHRSLIANGSDLAHARVWVVYDRGEENELLRGIAPERAAYLYDEKKGSLILLGRPVAPRRL